MKMSDILNEVVIDFNKFKQSRSKPVQATANLHRHDDTVATVKDHMDLLIDYIDDVKSGVKLPHFNHYDDIFRYISETLRYPFNKHNVEAWYAGLKVKDRSIVNMIAHHAPRLLKVLDVMEEKVNEFVKSVPKTVQMPDNIRYYQNAIRYDRSVLEALVRMVMR